MKKLLLAAFIAVLNWAPPAQATVNCTVPFNLTNGTTADATQVMANYNAILACLATSAASSGANADITSLAGLTTPLTPAQGGAIGLCGANKFAVARASTTTLQVTWLQAIVVNSLGALQYSTNGNVTLNFGTIGANGLDAGTLTSSTIFYLWLIGNGTVINTLASLSSTAPTLPSGYSFSCRIGAWYTTTIPSLVVGNIVGNKFMLAQLAGTGGNIAVGALLNGLQIAGPCGTATDTMALTTFTGLPVTAVEAIGTAYGGTGGSAFVSMVGPNTTVAMETGSNPGSASPVQFDLVLANARQIWACASANSAATNGSITITGWVDAVNAH